MGSVKVQIRVTTDDQVLESTKMMDAKEVKNNEKLFGSNFLIGVVGHLIEQADKEIKNQINANTKY